MTRHPEAAAVIEAVDRFLAFIESGELAFHGDSVNRARRAVLEREALREMLRDLGPRAPEAISYFCRILDPRNSQFARGLVSLMRRRRSETAGRRFRAARALGFSERPDIVVDVLVSALVDKEPLVRLSAAEALASLASATELVVRALKAALRDSNKRVRFQAAETLVALGTADEAVPPLAEGLASPSDERRERAAVALAAIGPRARSAAPLLLEALTREREPGLKAIQREAYARITGVMIGETLHGM